MAGNIKTGYKPIKNYELDEDGDYQLKSAWTHSDTVHLPDGDALSNKINRGVYLDSGEATGPEEINDNLKIDDTVIATNRAWSSQKTNQTINNKINDSATVADKTWSSQKIQSKLNSGAPSAAKLSVNGVDVRSGSEQTPVYFEDGLPKAFPMTMTCGNTNQSMWGKRIVPPAFVMIGKKEPFGDMVAAFIDYTGNVSYLSANSSLAIVTYNSATKSVQVTNPTRQKISIMMFGSNVEE